MIIWFTCSVTNLLKLTIGGSIMRNFIAALLAGVLSLAPIFASALEVGGEAPLFEAVSDKGPVNLLDYRGQKNVLLAFYFEDFSPV